MPELHVNTLVALLAFAAGIVFGATAQRTNFCTMGAISDMVNLQDYRRFRSWLLAIAVAIAGSQALHLAGLVDLGRSIYLAPNLGWLGAIMGGLMFGFGMTLAGGCGNKPLVRIGTGNLKSLVVAIVLGLFAYMTLRGIIGLARVAWIEPTGLALQAIGGQACPTCSRQPARTTPLQRLAWHSRPASWRGSASGTATSARARATSPAAPSSRLLIPAGWMITGIAGADDFDPTPLASLHLRRADRRRPQRLPDDLQRCHGQFRHRRGIGGVICGSFVAAIAARRFRVELHQRARHAAPPRRRRADGDRRRAGARRCAIRPGIAGLSTLAGSLLAFAAIVAGGIMSMKYLEEGNLAGAARAILARG